MVMLEAQQNASNIKSMNKHRTYTSPGEWLLLWAHAVQSLDLSIGAPGADYCVRSVLHVNSLKQVVADHLRVRLKLVLFRAQSREDTKGKGKVPPVPERKENQWKGFCSSPSAGFTP